MRWSASKDRLEPRKRENICVQPILKGKIVSVTCRGEIGITLFLKEAQHERSYQSAPVASLLAISGFANQRADGRDFDSGLRLERGSPSQLSDALDRDRRIFVLPGRNLRIAVRYSGLRDRAPEGAVCR